MTLKAHMTVLDTHTEEPWIAGALKVAFATTDMQTVNQHFGSTASLAIYAFDLEHRDFIEIYKFTELAKDSKEDKLAYKIGILEGCIAVYSSAIGASAVNQLRAKGVQPVKVTTGAEIRDLMDSLQEELLAGPSAWLAQAIKSQYAVNPLRFDVMEEEGWRE